MCVHTECTHAWAESHICNKAASHLCQFASSKYLRHSLWAFILRSVKYPATNTEAQHVVQIEKYSLAIPFQALWQMRTETSTKIIEVRGRFPKVARTLVILADTEWYTRSPESRGPIWGPDGFHWIFPWKISARIILEQVRLKSQV